MDTAQQTPIKPSTVLTLMDRVIDEEPDRELVYDRHRRMTYRQVADEAVAVGRFLRSCGVGFEDPVVVVLPNWCEFLPVRAAVDLCRAVIVPMVANVGPDSVCNILKDFTPKMVVLGEQERLDIFRNCGYAGSVLAVHCDLTGGVVYRYTDVVAGSEGSSDGVDITAPLPLDPMAKACGARVSTDLSAYMGVSHNPWPHNTSCIMYTAGTTGTPKGVMYDAGANIHASRSQAAALLNTKDDVFYCPMSFGHIFGMGAGLLLPLLAGARMVFIDRYRAEDSCKLIEQERCSVYFGVPTMFIRDFDANEDGRYDFSSLRTGIIAGDSTPRWVMVEYERRYGCRLLTSYGMTETSSCVTISRYSDPESIRYDSAGTVVGDEISIGIVDDEGCDLPPGHTGQIVVASLGMMSGYVNNPELTAEVFDDRCRYLTGDLGYITSDGALHVSGRLKDMIIRGGMNIYPSEVEPIYTARGDIANVRLVGYLDRVLGERTCLFVEPDEGFTETPQSLREYAMGKIEKCKVPDMVVIIDRLPRSASGKVDNRALCEILSHMELMH